MSGEPTECRVPVFQSGTLYATRGEQHDWRLHAREPKLAYRTEEQEGAPGYGTVVVSAHGFTETWYCSKCRRVEVREVGAAA